MVIWAIKTFLYSSSIYSCHLFLISSASVRSLPFMSFIGPILARNISLIFLIFLKRSVVFPSLLFSSISLHFSFKKAFFFPLAILWNSALSTLAFCFSSFLSYLQSLFRQTPCLLAFLFLWDGLVTASCTILRTSVHSSSGTLSTRSNPLYLFVTSTYNHKGFDLGHTWVAFFNLSLSFAIRSWWSESQSAPGLLLIDSLELLHFWLQRI